MSTTARSRRWLAAAVALALFAVPQLRSSAASSAPIEGSLYIDLAVRASGPIALVGDSLTYSYFNGLPPVFVAQQWGPFVIEARSARRIAVTASIATSGLDAVRRIRANGIDPSTWIVALGTNDMLITYRQPGGAAALIDTMMAEIGPGHAVVWVNVYSRDDPAETAAFNAALDAAPARHVNLAIADWHSVIVAHPQWVGNDGVHPTLPGAIARNEFVARAGFLKPCPPPPPGAVDNTVSIPIDAPGAVAGAQAVRLCRGVA